MTVTTLIITAERLAPTGQHIARSIGTVAILAGAVLIARAVSGSQMKFFTAAPIRST